MRGAEKKPLPTALRLEQRKKQTTVNAATRAAREAGVHTQGWARAQQNRRFSERVGGLGEPVG